RSKPLREPEGSVFIGRRSLSDPERDEDRGVGRHRGAELSKKCDAACAPGDLHVRRPPNDEAVVRRPFPWHVIRRTEHDVGADAELTPAAGIQRLSRPIISLPPPQAATRILELGRKKRSMVSRSQGKRPDWLCSRPLYMQLC